MGFFGFIETFFFISLAITFILIMLLVYHFKQRLTDVESKTDTMFEIMNNLLKEMKTIKTMVIENQQREIPLRQTQFDGFESDGHNRSQLGGMFDMMMPFLQGSNFNQQQNEPQDDIVSPIKIINLDTENNNDIDIDDIETIDDESDVDESDVDENDVDENDVDENDVDENDVSVEEVHDTKEEEELDTEKPLEIIDYKSFDIAKLRSLAIQRGIDPSKKKKGELIQLLVTL